MVNRVPKTTHLRNGWSYKGRCQGRDYVTVFNEEGFPVATCYRVKNALDFIRKEIKKGKDS